jgi:hypothetical protein
VAVQNKGQGYDQAIWRQHPEHVEHEELVLPSLSIAADDENLAQRINTAAH